MVEFKGILGLVFPQAAFKLYTEVSVQLSPKPRSQPLASSLTPSSAADSGQSGKSVPMSVSVQRVCKSGLNRGEKIRVFITWLISLTKSEADLCLIFLNSLLYFQPQRFFSLATKATAPAGTNQTLSELQSQKAGFYFLSIMKKHSGSSQPTPNRQKSESHLCSEVVWVYLAYFED